MNEGAGKSTRAIALKGGVIVVAGAVGVAAEGGAATSRLARDGNLRLYGRRWHLHAPERKAGQALAKQERTTTYGELLARPGGKKIGDFTAASFHVQPEHGAFAPASLEMHSFALEDGMIFGMGATAAEESVFSVIGGVGRYAGARGSYVARQSLRDRGGDGTAEILFTLTS